MRAEYGGLSASKPPATLFLGGTGGQQKRSCEPRYEYRRVLKYGSYNAHHLGFLEQNFVVESNKR
jgi:hypothetical protein